MRLIIFYINICLLLLCSGNSAFAETHPAENHLFSHTVLEQQQIKIKSTVPSTVLLESSDIDLDEEFHNSDNFDGTTKSLVSNTHFGNNWYLTFSSPIIFKDYSKRIKIFAPFCGYSNPIYIRQQVLRI